MAVEKPDMERWVVTDDRGSVVSAYLVGPGAETSARQYAEGREDLLVWKITEHWERG